MITVEKTYGNGYVRHMTVEGVTPTEDPGVVIMMTVEDGAVIVAQSLHGDLWAQLVAAGLVPS